MHECSDEDPICLDSIDDAVKKSGDEKTPKLSPYNPRG